MSSSRLRKPNQLTRESFSRLLQALHDDPDFAAREYESIHQALVTFFEFRGSHNAQDDADETIDRVARRLAEGREIFAANPRSYFFAVAGFVWRERRASPYTETDIDDSLISLRYRPPTPHELMEQARARHEQEKRFKCLTQCLSKLPRADRDLIEAYYQGDGGDKIKKRAELAAKLGIPMNALRLRAFRLRAKLEVCVKECAKKPA